jgi:hypothetical protein
VLRRQDTYAKIELGGLKVSRTENGNEISIESVSGSSRILAKWQDSIPSKDQNDAQPIADAGTEAETKASGKKGALSPDEYHKGYDSALRHVIRNDMISFAHLPPETEPVPESGSYSFNSDFASIAHGAGKSGKESIGCNVELEAHVSREDMARFAAQNAFYSQKYGCDFVSVIITWNKPSLTEYKSECLNFKPRIIKLHEMDDEAVIKKLEGQARAGKKVNRVEVVFLPIIGKKMPAFEKALKACDLIALIEPNLEKRKNLASAVMLSSNKMLSNVEKGELRKKMSMSALVDKDSIMGWADQTLVKEIEELKKSEKANKEEIDELKKKQEDSDRAHREEMDELKKNFFMLMEKFCAERSGVQKIDK